MVHLHEHGRVTDPRNGGLAVASVLAQERSIVGGQRWGTRPIAPEARQPSHQEGRQHPDATAVDRRWIPKPAVPVVCWSIHDPTSPPEGGYQNHPTVATTRPRP